MDIPEVILANKISILIYAFLSGLYLFLYYHTDCFMFNMVLKSVIISLFFHLLYLYPCKDRYLFLLRCEKNPIRWLHYALAESLYVYALTGKFESFHITFAIMAISYAYEKSLCRNKSGKNINYLLIRGFLITGIYNSVGNVIYLWFQTMILLFDFLNEYDDFYSVEILYLILDIVYKISFSIWHVYKRDICPNYEYSNMFIVTIMLGFVLINLHSD